MSETPPEGWPAYWKHKVATDLAEAQSAHARICSGLNGALLKVAQHHYPTPGTKSLYCAGCELEYRDAVGDWPCLTWALIVDTPPAPDRDALWGLIAELRSRMLGEPNGPAKMRGIEAIERALDTPPAPNPAEALALLGERVRIYDEDGRGIPASHADEADWTRRARALLEEQGRIEPLCP